MSSPSTDISEVWAMVTLEQIEDRRAFWRASGGLSEGRRALLDAAIARLGLLEYVAWRMAS